MNLAIEVYRRRTLHRDKGSPEEGARQLMAAKPNWMSMDYGTIEKIREGDSSTV